MRSEADTTELEFRTTQQSNSADWRIRQRPIAIVHRVTAPGRQRSVDTADEHVERFNILSRSETVERVHRRRRTGSFARPATDALASAIIARSFAPSAGRLIDTEGG
jgi:hypothetical protein